MALPKDYTHNLALTSGVSGVVLCAATRIELDMGNGEIAFSLTGGPCSCLTKLFWP
jgi:hypothetical protein